MATKNSFDLLGNDENDDPSQLIAAVQQQKLAQPKISQPKKPQAPAKVIAAATAPTLPSKPLPPSQAVREAKNEMGPDGGRGGRVRGRGRGRGRVGFYQDSTFEDNTFNGDNGYLRGYRASEDGDSDGRSFERSYSSPRGGRSSRRGSYSNGVVEADHSSPRAFERQGGEFAGVERPPRRVYERRSGTGRGNEFKRDGAGRGNWGTPADDISVDTEETGNESEKIAVGEQKDAVEKVPDASKEGQEKETEQKETDAEDKEMTLEEYEKLLEEKRKALQPLKAEERKVDVDKEFESMQQLSSKKDGSNVFIKLGSEKDKRKEAADKEDRVKKSVSINEFLKPADGEGFYGMAARGRGRGRGRGPPPSAGGYFPASNAARAPAIEDPSQFPSLSGK